MAPTITFPDFTVGWPFRRTLNPHSKSASAASERWVEGFHVLDDKAQRAFNRCKFSLLASLTYPSANAAHMRVACDLINWFFIFDQVSDAMDGPAAGELAARLIEIFRNPLDPRPVAPSRLEIMTASFWCRCLDIATPTSAKRFVETMVSYIEGVWQEAEDRVSGRMRKIDDYLWLRRETSGIKPAFDFILLTTEMPEKVINHPHLKTMTGDAVDLMIMLNDVYSWNYERSQGLDNHNLVSVVMAEKGLDPQEALDYVGNWYRMLANRFVQGMHSLPSFSQATDAIVLGYICGLGYAVTAYYEWAFESERYFGVRGAEIKESRVVELLPRASRK